MSRFVLIAFMAALLAFGANAQDSGKLLIQGGRIIPVVGDEIEVGDVLIENGRITAIGKDVKAPFDAMVIDATGKVVFPGVVEPFTSSGLDFANENVDQGSFLQVADAVDPTDRYFEEALRFGILTVHVSQGVNCVFSGVSRVMRPIGMTVQEMTIKGDGSLVVAIGPKAGYDQAVQMSVIRSTFLDLDRYLERRAEELYEEELKKKGEEVLVPPAEARKLGKDLVTLAKIDDTRRNLVRLRQGRLDAVLYCPRAMNVAPGLDVAKAQGFLEKSTLLVGAECHKVAVALKQSGRPVVLPASQSIHREWDRMKADDVETFVPKVFFDRKLAFAFANTTEPWYEAARAVRHGVGRKEALEAITLNGARAIGLESRLGSIEIGKDGTVVLLSGDPLDAMTFVDAAVIEGRLVYERSRDRALRELIQGVHDAGEREKRAKEVKTPPAAPKPATPAPEGGAKPEEPAKDPAPAPAPKPVEEKKD